MNKIQLNMNKILKLTNILKNTIVLDELKFDLDLTVEKMQSYIKVKGATQIGPLIQYTRAFANKNDELDMEIIMMLQCNKFIHSVENPYSIESTLRVKDCMYCRYIGSEDKLKFAYDKIQLEAFENDIALKGDSYTVFVDQNEEENTIIADVFMPRADN